MNIDKKIIGIDFGTTNSLAAYLEGEKAIIIPNQEGQSKTPSIVAFTEDDTVLVGEIARRQRAANSEATISSVKRIMGRDLYDIEEREEKLSFRIGEHDGRLIIKVHEKEYTPEEIGSFIFQKLRGAAENYLGDEARYAVITVPAYFDDLQRNSVAVASQAAGLEVIRLINEPTAAAMAYGMGKKTAETIAVYDFGGGTFDISILQVEENAFEVLSSYGDTYLGGDNLDNDLAHVLAEDFYSKYNIAIAEEPSIFARLQEAAEIAKCELSNREFTIVSLPFIMQAKSGPIHFERKIQRSEIENIIQPYISRTLECCEHALSDAALTQKDITCIILVGGSSRIPLVRRSVAEFFGKQPIMGLNPDEIVAMGAAIQGGVLEGRLQEVVLLDLTPHSLGIETKNGAYSKIIFKNSTIPIKTSKMFTTTTDEQSFVNIHVLQGESQNAAENRSLGKFSLTDIPPAPAGVPRIRVSFFINADGILDVSAEEISSGIEKKLTLIHSLIDMEQRQERRLARASYIDHRTPRRGYVSYLASKNEAQEAEHPREELVEKDQKEDVYSESRPEQSEVASSCENERQKSAYAFLDADETVIDLFLQINVGNEVEKETRTPTVDPEQLLRPDGGSLEKYEISFSENLHEAVNRIGKGDVSSTAMFLYQEAIEELLGLIEQYPRASNLYYILIKLYLLTGSLKKVDEILEKISEEQLIPHNKIGQLYDTVVRTFPSSTEARKQRVRFNLGKGDYDKAIIDLEAIVQKDEGQEWLFKLALAYENVLSKSDNPTIRFRLIKTYFKMHELDKSISLLQDLLENERYRNRALKILGLCLWQKKMLVQAWQKFKLLPMDEEISKLIYRLAKEMEEAEQLNAASKAYQRIHEFDPTYRDVDVRLKKISYRLTLLDKDAGSSLYDLKEPRFALIEEINRGSMGVIYKARDVVLDEIVALKVLNEFLLSDEGAVKRFKREAKAAKRLAHPNIVRIHDFYEAGNKKFISMEFIEGIDLRRALSQEGRIPEEIIIHYLRQILDAIEYAHNIGVVHRDIKPANIMITRTDFVKITDFGIAKIINVDEMTKAGTAIIGTPLYMAPEQILGAKIEPRTDIYSLGILLYEMVAGYPPFSKGNVEYHHVHTTPPELPDYVSDTMREVIMTCIKKKPEERFLSIRAIKEKLNLI